MFEARTIPASVIIFALKRHSMHELAIASAISVKSVFESISLLRKITDRKLSEPFIFIYLGVSTPLEDLISSHPHHSQPPH
jgi:hypothetical protein